jgi:hypothetical protein
VRPESLGQQLLDALKNYDVFISHIGADKPFARALGEALRTRGMTVWLDEWIIRPGDVLSRHIASGIESSRYFLILLSEEALKRNWVVYELDLALVRQVETRGDDRFVIPVVLDETEPPFSLRHLLYQRAATAGDVDALCNVLFPAS